MRYIFLSLLLLLLACKKDDDRITPLPNSLHYDGAYQAAPLLARGISYTAVRFPASEITRLGHQGKDLFGVDFHIDEVPDNMKLLVLRLNPDDARTPGPVLYDQALSRSTLSANRWNRHEFEAAIPLPAEGIWIVFEINAGNRDLRVIGCDPGPRHELGDIYGLFDNNGEPGWISYYQYSNQSVDINWNIRGLVR